MLQNPGLDAFLKGFIGLPFGLALIVICGELATFHDSAAHWLTELCLVGVAHWLELRKESQILRVMAHEQHDMDAPFGTTSIRICDEFYANPSICQAPLIISEDL